MIVRALSGRDPGVIGAALADRRIHFGVIAHGHHAAAANLHFACARKARTASACSATRCLQSERTSIASVWTTSRSRWRTDGASMPTAKATIRCRCGGEAGSSSRRRTPSRSHTACGCHATRLRTSGSRGSPTPRRRRSRRRSTRAARWKPALRSPQPPRGAARDRHVRHPSHHPRWPRGALAHARGGARCQARRPTRLHPSRRDRAGHGSGPSRASGSGRLSPRGGLRAAVRLARRRTSCRADLRTASSKA